MELTRGQEQGLKIAVDRYKSHEPYTCIAGYAGTGKTTLAKYIVDALNIPEEQVANIAYTGKASLVLKNKGLPNCMTAHKLLYHAKELPDGSYEFIPRKFLEYNFKLIIVDEVSMLPEDMWNLLLSHRVHVVALGDPEQLPPVDGISTILDNPHIFLDEIVRQALDNPIIKLSMDIREGKSLIYGVPKEARIMPYSKVSKGLLLGADIVICGLNTTRHALNQRMREMKWGDGYQDKPMDGDKVICLKNQWNTLSNSDDSLINGAIGTLDAVKIKSNKKLGIKMTANFISDSNGTFNELNMDYKLITTGEPLINKNNFRQFTKRERPMEFSYGYAITCHKSQGSEFDRVLVYDEPFGDSEMRRRWRYTAVTRASKQLVIIT